jgi:hypothetical protein
MKRLTPEEILNLIDELSHTKADLARAMRGLGTDHALREPVLQAYVQMGQLVNELHRVGDVATNDKPHTTVDDAARALACSVFNLTEGEMPPSHEDALRQILDAHRVLAQISPDELFSTHTHETGQTYTWLSEDFTDRFEHHLSQFVDEWQHDLAG